MCYSILIPSTRECSNVTKEKLKREIDLGKKRVEAELRCAHEGGGGGGEGGGGGGGGRVPNRKRRRPATPPSPQEWDAGAVEEAASRAPVEMSSFIFNFSQGTSSPRPGGGEQDPLEMTCELCKRVRHVANQYVHLPTRMYRCADTARACGESCDGCKGVSSDDEDMSVCACKGLIRRKKFYLTGQVANR